jgi:hypothetical protein
VFSVLVLGFFGAIMMAIDVNSNRLLVEWVNRLENEGYSIYYADFRPTSSMMRAETVADFETMLKEHNVTEAHYCWTQLVPPFRLVYGKIWFIDKGTTYYIET